VAVGAELWGGQTETDTGIEAEMHVLGACNQVEVADRGVAIFKPLRAHEWIG
jgi:hypothetical protein